MLCNPKNRHFQLMLAAEAACFAAALAASYLLRFEFRLPDAYAVQFRVMLVIALPLKLMTADASPVRAVLRPLP